MSGQFFRGCAGDSRWWLPLLDLLSALVTSFLAEEWRAAPEGERIGEVA